VNKIGINFHALLPETILSVFAIVIMLVEAFSRRLERRVAGAISLTGLVAALVAVFSLWNKDGEVAYSGMLITDHFRLFFSIISLLVGILIVLISMRWLDEEELPKGEYFAMLMFATTGMLFMASANDLVMIFLGLEITSISTYVLCGYRRNDLRSNESAVKYFILGSFSTAFLLYGIAMLYGASYSATASPVATTNLLLLKERIAAGHISSPAMLFAGAAMLLVGFGFKVATAPFHIWSPDVYEGAPTPVTALLSTGSKASAFAAFARVFVLTFAAAPVALAASKWLSDFQTTITNVLIIMAMVTMTVGNLVAIVQTNIKRMLAYSSIAHAGYALVGLAAKDWRSLAFYMLGYVLINIGAFAIIELIAKKGDKRTEIADYAGIGFKSLGLASLLSLFLLSLAGIPLTAGFMSKFLVFKSAWLQGSTNKLFYYLVVIGVINSAISWYYYLKVIVAMFFSPENREFKKPIVATSIATALIITALGTLFLGILPNSVLNALEKAREVIAIKK
jgi:NADH-quinone oxidoreductase subunit N